MQKIDTLFIGSATKDMLMQVQAPPASDQRIAATSFTVTCGGVAATAAVAHNRLGGVTGIVSCVGDDDTGRYVGQDMASQHFAYLDMKVYPGAASSTSMIQVEADGKRCLTCYGGCIDRLRYEDIDQEAVKAAKILHIGVLDWAMAEQLCRDAKAAGNLVSVDGGNIPLPVAERLLPLCDIFIPDNKTAMKTLGLGPEDACRWYVAHGAGLACVTAAEQGTWAFDGTAMLHEGTIPVKVVDTTGAGDNFHGAFLYATHQGWPLSLRVRFANIFASLTCEGMGGREKLPSAETVLALARQ